MIENNHFATDVYQAVIDALQFAEKIDLNVQFFAEHDSVVRERLVLTIEGLAVSSAIKNPQQA